MTRILLVEDDFAIVHSLQEYLNLEGFASDHASGQKEAEELLKTKQYQLLLLDVSLKDGDGFAVCDLAQKIQLPVIFLSASSDEETVVRGLNIGADDYITKPFNPSEVLARVNSQLRRYHQLGGVSADTDELMIGDIVLDDTAKKVSVDGNEVTLTPMEFGILKMLMKQPGKVFTSAEIYKNVWNDEPIGSESVIAVHIRHLREKIEIDPSEPRYIKVVWGQGYKMEDSHERAQ